MYKRQVLERGTSAGQRRVVAALGELEDEAGRQGIGTPAIIVVGEVCKLAETFGWYEPVSYTHLDVYKRQL